MKKLIILSLLFLAISTGFSQRYILFEDVDREWAERNTNFGPNKKHFVHSWIAAGQVLGTSADSLPAKYWGSGSLGFGVRYKHKLTSWWSHGFDLGYNYQSYSIAQKDEKMLLDNNQYEKERLNFHQISGDYYWRFRLGRAGNYIGKFFDIGGYGAWNMGKNHVIKAKDDIPNAQMKKTKLKSVNYLEDIEYGILARIGFPRLAFYGQYRLSALLKNVPESSETLPNITIGLEIKLN